MALHCSDAAFQAHFDAVLAARGTAGLVERVSLPGGPWWLAQAASLTEGRVKRAIIGNRLPIREAVDSMLGNSALKAVVLIGHQSCGWYERLHRGESAGQLVRRQGQDMFNVRDEVRRWSTRSLEVSGHMLVIDNDGTVSARQLF